MSINYDYYKTCKMQMLNVKLEVKSFSPKILDDIEYYMFPFLCNLNKYAIAEILYIIEKEDVIINYPAENCSVKIQNGSNKYRDYANLLLACKNGIESSALLQEKHCLLIHGAAIKHNGGAIIFPGNSNAGKTTTVLGMMLLREKYEYLSDDCVPVDINNFNIYPFPRPLNIMEGTKNILDKAGIKVNKEPIKTVDGNVWLINIKELGINYVNNPLPITHIVFPQYCTSNEKTTITPLSKSEAFKNLLAHVRNINIFGITAIDVIFNVVQNSKCFLIKTAELFHTVDILDTLIKNND